MELGGNILLEGFSDEPSDIVILKKIVGNFAKNVSNTQEITKLTLTLDAAASMISGVLLIGEKEYTASASKPNVYFCLDAVLKELSAAL